RAEATSGVPSFMRSIIPMAPANSPSTATSTVETAAPRSWRGSRLSPRGSCGRAAAPRCRKKGRGPTNNRRPSASAPPPPPKGGLEVCNFCCSHTSLARTPDDGTCQRVLAGLLDARGQPEQLLLGKRAPLHRCNDSEAGLPFGEGAGFVDDKRVHGCQLFQS